MTYAYAESTAVVGPLAPAAEPHSWDLCDHHAEKITAPLGWEMLRVNHIDIDDDEDLTALAEAVREAGRVTSGLVDADGPELHPADPADPETSLHPVHRARRVYDEKQRRRAHLRVVSNEDGVEGSEPSEAPESEENGEFTDR